MLHAKVEPQIHEMIQVEMDKAEEKNERKRSDELLVHQLTRNHFFPDVPSLAHAAVDWLTVLPFAQFCWLMGLDEQRLVFLQEPFS